MRAFAAFLVVIGALLLGGCVTQGRIARSAAKSDLGVAYYREGNVEGAIRTLEEAARLDPRSWRPLNALGVVYIAKGERALAEKTFRRALALDAEEAEILNNYGTLLVDLGRNEEAISTFEKALRDLDYRNPAMVQSNLSFVLLRAGRTEDALGYAREAVRRAPKFCRAWYNLGLVQEARKDPLAALEAYGQAVGACPEDADGARLRTGCIQVGSGLDDGIVALEDIVKRSPGSAMADEARACLRSAGR